MILSLLSDSLYPKLSNLDLIFAIRVKILSTELLWILDYFLLIQFIYYQKSIQYLIILSREGQRRFQQLITLIMPTITASFMRQRYGFVDQIPKKHLMELKSVKQQFLISHRQKSNKFSLQTSQQDSYTYPECVKLSQCIQIIDQQPLIEQQSMPGSHKKRIIVYYDINQPDIEIEVDSYNSNYSENVLPEVAFHATHKEIIISDYEQKVVKPALDREQEGGIGKEGEGQTLKQENLMQEQQLIKEKQEPYFSTLQQKRAKQTNKIFQKPLNSSKFIFNIKLNPSQSHFP